EWPPPRNGRPNAGSPAAASPPSDQPRKWGRRDGGWSAGPRLLAHLDRGAEIDAVAVRVGHRQRYLVGGRHLGPEAERRPRVGRNPFAAPGDPPGEGQAGGFGHVRGEVKRLPLLRERGESIPATVAARLTFGMPTTLTSPVTEVTIPVRSWKTTVKV